MNVFKLSNSSLSQSQARAVTCAERNALNRHDLVVHNIGLYNNHNVTRLM